MNQTGFYLAVNKEVKTENPLTGAFQFHHLRQTIFNMAVVKDFFHHARVKNLLYPIAKGVHDYEV